jgi:chromosome partitioning protein
VKTVAFFNNKGGVGKTSLVYHLAWMFSKKGFSVLAVDLDPQANLTSMFLSEDQLEPIWDDANHESMPRTIYGSLVPLINRTGDIVAPQAEKINKNLALLSGDLRLSRFEDLLSENWPKCLSRDAGAFRIETAFYRIILNTARQQNSEIILIDVGPNLGAINRAALISADYVVLPLAPDLFSIQGLKNLGPTLREWRDDWKERQDAFKTTDIPMPSGNMEPIGYVVMQHSMRSARPVKAYTRWLNRIPEVYRESILAENITDNTDLPSPEEDPYDLVLLKHYRSLMPLAMEANKPMFSLTPADGAIGAHVAAVQACYADFDQLAKKIADLTNIDFIL